MGFIETAFLTATAAIAVPVVIHLIHHWQIREVELGTVRFLAEIICENARRKRVKRWLLLALRTLAMTLLALLFARPHLNATSHDHQSRFVGILIDRSASMSLRQNDVRLVDKAVQQAKQLIQSFDSQTHWELAFFDHRVEPLAGSAAASSVNRMELLDLPPVAYSATAYGAAMAWARDQCVRSTDSVKEVYVYTDLQRSGLDWAASSPFPADVQGHVIDLGRDQINNVAIVNAKASSVLVHPGDGVEFQVTVFNHSPLPMDNLDIQLSLSSEARTIRHKEKISLAAGASGIATIEVASLESGFWQGTVDVDVVDELTFDNRHHVAVLSSPPKRVLIVDGGKRTGRLSETWLLQTALRLAAEGETFRDSPFQPESISLSAGTRLPALQSFDLVLLSNPGGLAESDAGRIARFVKSGKGLLVFSGDTLDPLTARPLSDAGLIPGQLGETVYTNDLPYRWQKWDVTHALFEPFQDVQYGDLRRLSFTAYTPLEPDPSAQVLATFNTGDPALLEHRLGTGRVLWFTSGCSREWGDWTRSRLFLPVLHQMLADLSNLTGGGPVVQTVIDVGEESSADIDLRPGVHSVGNRWQVVNVGSRESEVDRCSIDELVDRFQFTAAEDADDQPVEPQSLNANLSLRADEIWHWFVLVLVALLAGEAFLANRTTA